MSQTGMIDRIGAMQDFKLYRELAWEGSFEEYLGLVRERPQITRNAYQRLYDMVISFGTEEYIDNKKKLTRYNFFRDEMNNGANAIFGLDIPLMRLVHVLKAAAEGYGPEKRVILLHGPVGSSKSTIARLLKQGIEYYSRTTDGALYTYRWINLKECGISNNDTEPCPMHDEPLRLIPLAWRQKAIDELALSNEKIKVRVEGDLNPSCRFIFKSLLDRYKGDWGQVIQNHIGVTRLLLSEKDRVGIGTFQPKDEKNQDATELTGDINYRKIAEYGSESATPAPLTLTASSTLPTVASIEFVEVLKLDVAFLYDLLGASAKSTRSNRRSLPRRTSMKSSSGTPTSPNTKNCSATSSWRRYAIAPSRLTCPYVTKLQEEVRIYEKDYNQPGEGQRQEDCPAHPGGCRHVGHSFPPGRAQKRTT